MLTIETPTFNDLADEERESVPDNGSGKEFASYIRITHNGQPIGLYSDAMEPEDCLFYRDLRWIPSLIGQVYRLGLSDASESPRD